MAEWNLSQVLQGDQAYGYFEAAIETCTLYEITIDKRISDCIEASVKEFLTAQRKNAIQMLGTNAPGHVPIPLSVRTSLSQTSLPRLAEILIALEIERVKSMRAAETKMAASNVKIESVSESKKGRENNRPEVLTVLIASPSDVGEERDAVTAAIYDWNAGHTEITGILLQPIKWETHSYPESGDRPQALLNRQIVDRADFVIGIFGNRVGTPTGIADSGTIEEIEQFRTVGKHVDLYFSDADVPRNVDRKQLDAVEKYRKEREEDSKYDTFKSSVELREKVRQTSHLNSC
jgi:hypothetical protein